MKEIRNEDLDQGVFDLFDKYVHSDINRRQFMDGVSKYAVGGLTAVAIFDFLAPKYAVAQQVRADDPRLDDEYIEYDSPKGGGTIRGLLSQPEGNKDKLPGVVVVHENRGLNPHIEDVTRRAGLANFLALGPDALWPLGGYPGTDDEGRTMQRQRDRREMLQDFMAAFEYLKAHPNCNGKVGVVGFCFGGWISNLMAVELPELKAAVPFYGGQPSDEETAKINAPLLIHYAGLDKRVNAGWLEYEAALKANNKEYVAHFYPEVNHGFHNDTTPRYDEASAKLAWKRTTDFFDEKLRS